MSRRIEIQVDERGFGAIKVDGQELRGIRAVTFECEAGNSPKVVITLASGKTEISADAEVIMQRE